MDRETSLNCSKEDVKKKLEEICKEKQRVKNISMGAVSRITLGQASAICSYAYYSYFSIIFT